jgi:hypothetical protein
MASALHILLVALICSLVGSGPVHNAYAFDSPFLLTYIESLSYLAFAMKYITNKLIEPCFQSSLYCHSVVPVAVEVADINDACSAYCKWKDKGQC